MIKRPKPTDTEQEILDMQKSFLSEQTTNVNFQPAAKLVKLNKPKNVSQFAQKRAQLHQQETKSNAVTDDNRADLTNESVNFPKLIIGNIVERKEESSGNISQNATKRTICDSINGFPKPQRIDRNVKVGQASKKSLFAVHQMQKMETESIIDEPSQSTNIDFGSSSNIIDSSDAQSIHKENTDFLKNYGEEEIITEQNRLLGTLDASLVKFLQEKRRRRLEQVAEDKSMNVEIPMEKISSAQSQPPDLDLLKTEGSNNWLNFDIIETEKLEWMRDLPSNMPELKAGETYEARFDWKGVLLPFTFKDESTSTDLFLHGDDAHRPGYTLHELFRLARSTMVQQRISAIGSIGGILSIYNQGFYDGIFELPISKIFFLLRYAFDDNTPAMLEITAKAISTLFYNETDEILLDMTYDCSFDYIEPTLEINVEPDHLSDNTTELHDQFSKLKIKKNVFETNFTDDENNESSLNDFHLAETDLIKCLLRTNIIQRISYIFSSMKLENSTNLSCVKLLIRLARTSKSVVETILTHPNLLICLIRQFYYSPQNSDFSTIRLQNKIKIFTLKLFRVMCSYESVFIDRLREQGLNEILRNSIFVQENSITVETVKVQIEALRCTKVITSITKSDSLFE